MKLNLKFRRTCQIQNIYFYGAGCAHKAKQDIVHGGLRIHFPEAKIEVHSDLLGAARSLCEYKEGSIGILGNRIKFAFTMDISSVVKFLLLDLFWEMKAEALPSEKILKQFFYSELPKICFQSLTENNNYQ